MHLRRRCVPRWGSLREGRQHGYLRVQRRDVVWRRFDLLSVSRGVQEPADRRAELRGVRAHLSHRLRMHGRRMHLLIGHFVQRGEFGRLHNGQVRVCRQRLRHRTALPARRNLRMSACCLT
jgi:hypothetical protein